MESLLEQFESMKSGMLQNRQEIFSTIDSVMTDLETTRDQVRIAKLGLAGDNADEAKLKIVTSVNTESKKLESMKPTQKIVDTNVEYFKHISKFGKNISKYMNPSIEDATYQVKFPIDVLNRVPITTNHYINRLLLSIFIRTD